TSGRRHGLGARRMGGGQHTIASSSDDSAGDDHRDATDVAGPRGGRRTERSPGSWCNRRAGGRNIYHTAFCSGRVQFFSPVIHQTFWCKAAKSLARLGCSRFYDFASSMIMKTGAHSTNDPMAADQTPRADALADKDDPYSSKRSHAPSSFDSTPRGASILE